MNKFYAIIECNEIIGKGQCPCTGENITSIEITQDVYDNLERYMYDNGAIVLNPNYEKEQEEKRLEEFKKNYFETSLGWVSRKVHMTDGSLRDFLFDILPALPIGETIITYNLDSTQNFVQINEQFLNECKTQIKKDFWGG